MLVNRKGISFAYSRYVVAHMRPDLGARAFGLHPDGGAYLSPYYVPVVERFGKR